MRAGSPPCVALPLGLCRAKGYGELVSPEDVVRVVKAGLVQSVSDGPASYVFKSCRRYCEWLWFPLDRDMVVCVGKVVSNVHCCVE